MMNSRMKQLMAGVVLIVVLLALAVNDRGGVAAAKDPATTCSNATLKGSYGNVFQFLNLLPGSPVPQPIGAGTHFAGAGFNVFTFDGAGSFSGPSRLSFGGLIISSMVAGTYTVNSNCTGSIVAGVVGDPSTTFNLEFVIVDDGNEVHTLSTVSGDIAVGTMKKQFK